MVNIKNSRKFLCVLVKYQIHSEKCQKSKQLFGDCKILIVGWSIFNFYFLFRSGT